MEDGRAGSAGRVLQTERNKLKYFCHSLMVNTKAMGTEKRDQGDLNVENQRHEYAMRSMSHRDVLARGGAGILKVQERISWG